MRPLPSCIRASIVSAAFALAISVSFAHEGGDDPVDYYKSLKPGPHPYLFFDAQDIPRLREKMNVSPTKEMWEWTKRFCEKALSKPFQPLPKQTYYEQTRRRAHNIEGLAFAYVLTGDSRYADRAVQEVEAFLDCEWWIETHRLYKGKLRTVDRVTARVAFVMAEAYDWLYDLFTPEQRERIRRITLEKAIAPLMRGASDGSIGWMKWYRGNWCLGTHGQIGSTAVAFLAEEQDAARWLVFALENLKRGLAEGGRDGGWGEGCQYYVVAWCPPARFASALKRVTKGEVNLFEHPFLKNVYQFPLYFLMPNQKEFVRFGNCNVGPYHSTYFFVILASQYENPYAQWLAARGIPRIHGTFQAVFSFIFYDHDLQPKPPSDLPLAKHFRGVDWAVFRSGWDSADDIFFAFKGGTGDWDHIHGDFNSFTLYAYGSRLIVDQGYPHEVWGCRTEAHNTIRVNSQDQFPRTNPAGGARQPQHVCEISEFVHTDLYGHLVGDATTAYDSEDVRKFTREVMFIRPDIFVIFDDVVTMRPLDVDWSVHTFGDLAINGDMITIRQDNAAVDIAVIAPQKFTHEILSKNWQEVGIRQPFETAKADTFIKLRSFERRERTNFLTVLRPRRAEEKPKLQTNAIAQGDLIGVTIETDGATALALFATQQPGISYGDLRTDARSCFAALEAGKLNCVAIHGGSEISYKGQSLFRSAARRRGSFVWEDPKIVWSDLAR